MFRFISFTYLIFFLFACATPADYFLYGYVQEAFHSAKQARADQSAPSYYTKAVSYFNIGESEFRQKNYASAHDYFQKSKDLFETAELISYLKRSQGGQLR